MKESVSKINERLKEHSIHEVLEYFLRKYKGKIAQASSLGAEDQVLTDLILQKDKNVKIFTLDTGRLHEQTYQVMADTNNKYQVKMDIYFPDYKNIQQLYKDQGVNGFKESVENRKTCCYMRKIEPLKRALSGLDVWITRIEKKSIPNQRRNAIS